MRKRITLLVAATMLALTMALGSAGAAFGQTEPVCTTTGPGGGGISTVTCVETSTETFEETQTTSQKCQFNQGGQRSGEQEVTTTNTFEVTTTTTTVTTFQGNPKSGNVKSGPTSTSVDSPPVLIDTETTTGECRNTPGPQRG
jgi:hypothetical protein